MSDTPSLMPPSATPLMRALDLAIRPAFHEIPHVLRWLHDPQRCPPEALAHLAWAWSVDVWNDAWPDAIKRRVIAGSLAVHRVKGSAGSVRRALEAVAVDSELVEWFDLPNAPPHTFTAILTPTVDLFSRTTGILFHDALIDEVKRVIDATRPLRSHYLVRVRPRLLMTPGIAAGMACRMEIRARGAIPLPRYAARQPLGIALGAAARGTMAVAAAPPLPRYAARKPFRITAAARMIHKVTMTMTAAAP